MTTLYEKHHQMLVEDYRFNIRMHRSVASACSFNPFPNDKFHALPNLNSLQTTISKLMKTMENSLNA